MNQQFKAAVSIAEMARMSGLSRSRFYQLIGTAFPEPSRDEMGRPFYTEEQQRVCMEVRRRNHGIDGKPVLFYAPRSSTTPRRALRATTVNPHAEIIEGVKALGLAGVTSAQVDVAIGESFPNGVAGVEPGELIRAVFLSIRRKNSSGNDGR
jgi:hypothetical protein